MTKAFVEQIAYQIARREGQLLINEQVVEPVIHYVDDQFWTIDFKGKTHTVFFQKTDPDKKETVLVINGKRTTVTLETRADQYLKSLGMDKAMVKKMSVLKSPMPGLIHGIQVAEGQSVTTGEPLIILEAMKMENVIKAAGDGVVKRIHVTERSSVEKNQLLISFE